MVCFFKAKAPNMAYRNAYQAQGEAYESNIKFFRNRVRNPNQGSKFGVKNKGLNQVIGSFYLRLVATEKGALSSEFQSQVC